jgi:hypothetical protein
VSAPDREVRLVAQAIETLEWQHVDDDGKPGDEYDGEPGDDVGVAWETLCQLVALIRATDATAPEGFSASSGDGKATHRAVLDIMGHGVGLWEDSGEVWEGEGEAWSERLANHPGVLACGWYSSISSMRGDDGLLYLG